ncbi:MAG: hypothetical protein ACJ762_16365 [Solirubrobacteraceae bacterium]
MERLTEAIPALHIALTAARRRDRALLDEALRRFGVTGVHGEAEVGITSLIAATIDDANHPVIRVDLDGATSADDVTWLLARGLARAVLGPTLSVLLGPSEMRPTSAQQHYIQFAETVGSQIADLALSDQGMGSSVDAIQVLDVIGRVYEQSVQPPVLWIDHLQAPALTPRHPVDVDALLWNVRSVQQRFEMPVIISGHRMASPIAYRRSGAFHGDGQWVTIGRPGVEVWTATATALEDFAPTREWIAAMTEITHGHPATMLLALALNVELGSRPPLELWRIMLSSDDGHVARAVQHARSLHRLGGRVLELIAIGIGPYEDAQTDARRKEIYRAVTRLHEGGLITQPRPRAWELTNPLLAGRLRGEAPTSTDDAAPRQVHEGVPTDA